MKKKSYIVIIIIVLLTMIEMRFYTSHLHRNLEEQNWMKIKEITSQQLYTFEENLRNDVMVVENYANLVSEGFFQGKVTNLLATLSQNTNFEYFSYATLDGNMVYPNDIVVNVQDRSYFHQVQSSLESVISEPIPSKIRDSDIIAIATPLFRNDVIHGLLVGTYDYSYLNDSFHSSYNNLEYVFIINENQELIATTHQDSNLLKDGIFVVVEESEILEGKTYQDVIEEIYHQKEGRAEVKYQGIHYYLYFMNSTINNWKIFTLVPASEVTMQSDAIESASWFVVFTIFLMYLIFFLYRFASQKKSIKQIEKLLYYDEVSRLPTVHKLKIDVEQLLIENNTKQYSVSKIDIVNFKLINELFGFEVGDTIVREIGNLFTNNELNEKVKACARIGQDEFWVVKEWGINDNLASLIEDEISSKVADVVNDSRIEFRIGRAMIDCTIDFNTALERANMAHSICKQSSSCKMLEYDDTMKERMIRESYLTRGMYKGIENREFKLYLQPKVDIHTQQVKGYEALVRWIKDDKMISPVEFIELFEKNNFVRVLDYYMFEEVCVFINELKSQNCSIVPISVNFSKKHLHVDSFVSDIASIANKYEIDPALLEIELTESTIFNDINYINKVIEELHSHGFKVSMDDFGSGSSSLGLLSNIEVDILKLDRSFFVNITNLTKTKILLESIITFAKNLDLEVVAEGVEEESMIAFLKEVNCDLIQSYYYSKPLDKELIRQIIIEKREFR